MSDVEPAVRADGLVKQFDAQRALDRVSFAVEPSEIFGFIGPDGAGKTTLFRILVSLLEPDEGMARVLGLDVVRDYRTIRRCVGYMPGRFSLYGDLSVEENLRFFASVFGTTPEAEYELIAPVYEQVKPFRDRRAAALSGGMKQKLALSCALVHRPDVLFLDEPTTGVDAVSRREFWDLLGTLREGGLTIVVSTPYMDEASRCDRVALIQNGSILRIAAPDALGEEYDYPLLAVRAPDRYGVLRILRTYDHARSVYPFGEALHYTDARRQMPVEQVAGDVRGWLGERGVRGARVEAIEAGVEDVFMEHMGARPNALEGAGK